MRDIVRSACIGPTARRLKTALQARSIRRADRIIRCDYRQDLLLAYPPAELVDNTPPSYSHTAAFYGADKATQRIVIGAQDIPTIPTKTLKETVLAGERFVVRPLRHRAGIDFRVTQDQNDFIEGREYVAKFIDKQREYRILYYKGNRVCVYRKLSNSPVSSDQPWTHLHGFRFVTIEPGNCRIPTSLFNSLAESTLIKTSHLVGVDVLYDGHTSLVCEFNLSPGISIPNTINRIAEIEASINTAE